MNFFQKHALKVDLGDRSISKVVKWFAGRFKIKVVEIHLLVEFLQRYGEDQPLA